MKYGGSRWDSFEQFAGYPGWIFDPDCMYIVALFYGVAIMIIKQKITLGII